MGIPIMGMPVGMYIDSVPYSQTDSVFGVWFFNIVSGVRHLGAIVRKKALCACGCRGWCSLDPLFRWVAWSICAMGDCRYPTARHNRAPFNVGDDYREALAGDPLPMRMCVLYLKADWAEFASTITRSDQRLRLSPSLWTVATNAVAGP